MSLAKDLLAKLPKHAASLALEHNRHKDVYETAAQVIAEHNGYYSDGWISPEQKAKAIETNEIWTLHWYPNTPIGFNLMHAADLEALFEALEKRET